MFAKRFVIAWLAAAALAAPAAAPAQSMSGGKIHVIVKPGLKHHPHGLDDPKPAVDFIVKQLGLE